MNDRLLRRREVEELTGLSRASIYRLMRRGRFPRPVRVSATAVSPSTVNGYPLHPAPAAVLVYEQMQAVAVRVAPGVPERSHPCCR